MKINIRTVNNTHNLSLEIDPDNNVGYLRKKIADSINASISDFKIIFGGHILKEDRESLSLYNIKDNYTIILVVNKNNIKECKNTDNVNNNYNNDYNDDDDNNDSESDSNNDSINNDSNDDSDEEYENNEYVNNNHINNDNDINELLGLGFSEENTRNCYILANGNKEFTIELLLSMEDQ